MLDGDKLPILLARLERAGFTVEFAYRTGECRVVLLRSGVIRGRFKGETLEEATGKAKGWAKNTKG